MVQLAHVSGPRMLVEGFERRWIERGNVLAVALRVAVKEMVRKEVDVLAAVPQRRQVNLDGIQPEEKVLTEPAGRRFGVYVRVGRGENAHIHTACGRGTDALEIARFQNAEKFCLQVQGDV